MAPRVSLKYTFALVHAKSRARILMSESGSYHVRREIFALTSLSLDPSGSSCNFEPVHLGKAGLRDITSGCVLPDPAAKRFPQFKNPLLVLNTLIIYILWKRLFVQNSFLEEPDMVSVAGLVILISVVLLAFGALVAVFFSQWVQFFIGHVSIFKLLFAF